MVQLQKSRHALKQEKKKAKREAQEQEHEGRHHTKKKRKVTLYSIIGVVGVIVIISVLFFVMGQSDVPGPYDSFAKCLTEAGATMYGAFWCPHCADQKKLFERSFKFVNYVECDANGKDAQPQLCDQNGIKSYPTWIIDGKPYSGLQQLQRLATLTECSLE